MSAGRRLGKRLPRGTAMLIAPHTELPVGHAATLLDIRTQL